MRIYTRIVLDMTQDDMPVIESESYEYDGPLSLCMPSDGAGGRSGGDGDRGSGGSTDSERGGGSDNDSDRGFSYSGPTVGNRTASRGGFAKEDALGGLAEAAGINNGRTTGKYAGAALGVVSGIPAGGLAGGYLGSKVGAAIGGAIGAAKDRDVLGGGSTTGSTSGGSIGSDGPAGTGGTGTDGNQGSEGGKWDGTSDVLTFSNGMNGSYNIPKATYEALQAAAKQDAATASFLTMLNNARAQTGNSEDLIAKHNANVDRVNQHSAQVFGDRGYTQQRHATSLQSNPNPKQYDIKPSMAQKALDEIEAAKRAGARIYVR